MVQQFFYSFSNTRHYKHEQMMHCEFQIKKKNNDTT